MTMLWTPPAPASSYPAARPQPWSMRRTALAIVGAIAIGAAATVGVSYADTGSSGSGTGAGGFGGRSLPGGGFRGGFLGGPGGAGGGFGSGLGQQLPGSGQLGSGQVGGQPQPTSNS
jgi:hypothetical protein